LLGKLILKNYALVDQIEIDFGPGLTVLTGETGAGKSVIIGGLLLTLGGRSDKEFIRHGEKKASAEARFDLSGSPLSRRIREQFEIPLNASLSLSREVWATGLSRGYVEGRPENISKIRRAASVLADFHSEQGHRHLLEAERHIDFLDSFAGLSGDVEKLARLFEEFTSLNKQLNEAKNNAAAAREKLELINFQIDELTKSNIRIGEEEELESERKRLESVQTLMDTGRTIINEVGENDDCVLSILSGLDKQLKNAAGIDRQLSGEASLLTESVINLNEMTRNLESYLSGLEDNPQRLEFVNARLVELYRLKKKYNTNEAGLPARLEELKNQSQGAGDYNMLIKSLSEKLTESRAAYHNLALAVSEKRKKAAGRLEKKVVEQLADLAIAKARFKIDFQYEPDENGFDLDDEKIKASPHGLENIEFLISTNPNEPLRPLIKIASGGEVSRIMLALLTVIAGKYKLPTIIFDEIDTGIGGRTAIKLAEKLKELSKKHQVITISHLPAIAAKADHHLAVTKSLKNGRNIISIKKVTGPELKREIKRMQG
jgi:DNA repair protein RecN (Recombination protein N)